MMFTLNIYNSYCKFSENIPVDILAAATKLLTIHNDIQAEKAGIFIQIRNAKRFNNEEKLPELFKKLKKLEENEWVCWLNNLSFPTGHLNLIKDLLNQLNIKYNLVDNRTIPKKDFLVRWNNEPYVPRYYQTEMIDLGLTHHRGVFESAVGTGKSLIMTYLINTISVNSLIVVPSTGLGEQLYRGLLNDFGTKYVQKVNTAKVRNNSKLKPIRIITIQSLASLQKTGEIQKLVSDIHAIYIDEIHHAGSDSYLNLLPEIDHIYYRFGFTGTFLRNDHKTISLWGFLSTKLYSYPAYKAIEDGFLTPIKVNIYNIKGKQFKNYQKEYKHNYCGKTTLIFNKIGEIIKNINSSEQILILVNRKDQSGEILHKFLELNGFNNAYISGDDSANVINDTIEKFNRKEINILIGSSVIGEGIDICSTDHLIMAQGGKSEIAIVQALGRLARLFTNKTIGYVHDFNFVGTKYLAKHLRMRKDIYINNFSPKEFINKD